MKKKLLVIVFSIIAVFSLVLGVAACKNDNPSGSKDDPQQLSTPVVSISEDGLASWTEDTNASGYAYKLDDGEETNTDSTSVQLTDGQSITVKAVGDGTNYTDSAWSAVKTYNAQSSAQKLNTPVVTIDGEGVASWTADSNAVGYIVKIDGVDGELTTETSVTLTEGQKIQVKAVGDGTNYSDSEWSAEKTYGTSSTGIMTHAQYLAAAKGATVKVQGVVTGIGQDRVYFQDSDGGYLIYGINNLPAEVAVGKTIVAEGVLDIYSGLYEITNATVTVGDTATVTPIDITDLFTAATSMTDATIVNTQSALVTIKGVTLKVSSGNLYVVIGNNEAQLFVGSGKSHVLDADALAAVKAAVEANEGATADVTGYVTLYQGTFQIIPAEDALDIKGAQTLGNPVVTITNEGVASWTEITGATKYVYQIKEKDSTEWGTETEVAVGGTLSVTLTNGQSIRVKAVGNGTTYNDSDWTEETYTKLEIMTHAQYLAAAKGDTVLVQGVVTGLGQDRVYFQDSDGGYLVYGISNLPADVAVGKTITAQGVLDIYNGLYEITNATVTVGETAAVTPIDITEIFTAANGMSAAALVNMQSALVTIKGVTLKVSGSNLYVVIGNNEAQIFVGSGKSHVLDADALAAVKALVEANVGATADVTGYVTLYSNAFQLIPAADAIDIDTSVAAKLATPVVTINKTTGVASWAANNNAEGYIVKIDGVDGELTTETSVTLTNGQKIQVKAVGDGENYTDSDWSAEQTYTAKVPVTNGVEFDFSFISDSSASSTAYTATTATEAFKEACDNAGDFVSVTATEKVYPGDKDSSSGRSTGGLIKFSTSSVNGSVTLSFNKKAVRVVINCIAWQAASGSYDASKIKVNSATEQNVPQVATDLTFDITASNTVTISSTAKRFNIYSIIVYFENVEPTPLTAPEVTIDLDGLATWEPVTGATGYEYVITHSDSTTTTDTITATQVQLTDGDKIKVKSLGDGEDYISSDYGTEVTYTMVPVTLGVPVVEVNHAGVASWDAVENAVKYVYVINDGEEQETTHRTVQLTNGQSIKVKAVGKEGSRFQASAYCEPVTYTAPTVAEQLENPTVTVAIDGTVTIENENAVSFDYTIGDGEKQNVANGEDGAAVTLATKLTNGQTIKVVAKGDGTYYTDSAEVEITYTAPQALEAVTEVTIAIEGNTANKVVITWTAVANATGYSYQIGSAAAVTTTDTTLTVTLNEGTVFSITALGNTATAETAANGDYSAYYLDSTVYAAPAFNIDNEKTYTVSEIVKIAKYYGTTAPSKEFTVTGVVSSNAAYSTQYSNIDVVLKEGSDTFTVFRANFSAELLDTWKTAEANALVDCTVTATGKPFYYNSSTLEFNSGCKITAVEMSAEIRVAKAKAAMDDKLDCETTDEDYTYTLPLTGEFGTTITWSFEGLEEDDYIYDDEEGTLLVTRKDTEITFTATATISYTNGDDKANDTLSFELTVLATGSAVPETPKEVTETFTLNPLNGYTSGTAVTSLTSGDVTLTFAKGGNSSNEPKYYTANPSGVRCYPKNTITVTADGQTITKIELTYSGSNAITADNGTYNNNVWTGSATSVTFTIDGSSGNNAMTKIVVTYEAKPITEEDITVALNKISLEASYEATSFDVQTKIDRVEISWTSSNNEYVTINNETGKVTINCEDEQTVTLTATAECTCGEDTHHTKTFSVKVKKPSTSEPVTVTMKSTLSSGNMSKTENNAASVNLDASIFNVLSSGGSNNVGTYAELRMYKGNILTVSATGVTILSIKITISSSSYNPTHAVKAGDTVVTGTVSDLVEEYTINASSFSITNNASDNTQLRIKEIEITYQVG